MINFTELQVCCPIIIIIIIIITSNSLSAYLSQNGIKKQNKRNSQKYKE